MKQETKSFEYKNKFDRVNIIAHREDVGVTTISGILAGNGSFG
jgi:hypothetical protein